MGVESSGIALEDLLRQTREALDTLGQARSAEGDRAADAGGPVGLVSVGEACDGQVRAEVVDGRLESLVVDPRLTRLDPEGVVDRIREAVNQALEGAGGDGVGFPVDLDLLAEQVCRVQEESLVGMARIGRGLDAVVERLRQAGR